MNKILIVRFSSFGDIVQCMGVLPGIKEKYPDCEIHWLTRSDFEELVQSSNLIDRVIAFDKSKGLAGLIKLARSLKKENYDVFYDAHNNLRSLIIKALLLFSVGNIIVRSKNRLKRILLFKFRKNLFEWPFSGIKSYQEPLQCLDSEINFNNSLQTWSFREESISKLNELIIFEEFIALAPSAAWEMKRWPIEHWKSLISLSDKNFVILGGPADTFCEELCIVAPSRVINLAGKISLIESCLAVTKSLALVSADTGLLHVADILNIKGIALIGPTAFGYPTNSHVKVLEMKLSCSPCTKDGRGKCIQQTYQKCLKDITPEMVKINL